MKWLILILFIISSQAFAENCNIFLSGEVTAKQINMLVKKGFQIANNSKDSPYQMHTTHEVVDTYLERANQYNTAPIYITMNVYRTKVFVYKDGKIIRAADSLQEKSVNSERDLVGRVQKKIIRKINNCEI